MEIIVNEELKNFITPLTKEERHQLEENLLEEGCKDPLVVWRHGGKFILIDGHHRYKICVRHNIPYQVIEKLFDDIDGVRIWMINNQLGRRNLISDQLSYLRGIKYYLLKSRRGGYQNVQNKGVKDISTSKRLSEMFKVSESTIKRDAKFARGVDIIARSNPKLKSEILAGDSGIRRKDIQELSEMDDALTSNLTFSNEADFFNKIEAIRRDSLRQIEEELDSIEKATKEKSQEGHPKIPEPLFSSVEDRLKTIKGRIISAINEAIESRDVDAIQKLKDLIQKLEKELLTYSIAEESSRH